MANLAVARFSNARRAITITRAAKRLPNQTLIDR
jgi:hypothetical protein